MQKLRMLVDESEDVADDIDDNGTIKCSEGPIKKLRASNHYRKPSSKRYMSHQYINTPKSTEKYKLFH